ncbi:hypothetical protein [Ferroplasma sp.]|uniref:hypothetical protein n=1 Tax=Ferroplasma sp. TaxID=2591003 RepID=UPI00307DFA25
MVEFPKFHCCVNQNDEEYDSEIQMYFVKEYDLAELLARLADLDKVHAGEYKKMVNYIQSLENYIITGEKPEDFHFLEDMEGEKGWANDYKIILSDSRAAHVAFRGCKKVIEVLYYYRLVSRKSGFTERFTSENFRSFLLMRDILYKRASELMKN